MGNDSKEEKKIASGTKPGVTRRSFLGGSLTGAALLAAGSLGLTGCADGAGGSSSVSGSGTKANSSQQGHGEYEVFNADLLIVGSGFGGISGAFQALDLGMNVVMVDKGPFISSGAMGLNYDLCASWYYSPAGYARPEWSMTVADQDILLKIAPEDNVMMHMDSWWINHGETFAFRNEDGSPKITAEVPGLVGFNEHVNARLVKCSLEANPNVLIHEQTMLTDLIIQDGKCLGAVGIYLPTGAFRVYRAKATMLSSGGCGWMYGWNTVAPYSPQVPDNTSDLEMAAWRKGAGIGESEWTDYDVMSVYPSSICCGYAGGVGADSGDIDFMTNSDGEYFYNDAGYYHDALMGNRALYARIIAEQVNAGKGSPHGGVFVDYSSQEIRDKTRYGFIRNIALFQEVFGIDVTKELVEVVPELEEHGGAPVIGSDMMSIDFDGLFCHRGAGPGGESTVTGSNKCATLGAYTARCAIEYIGKDEESPEVDWSLVEQEYERLNTIRTSAGEGGVRPVAVRRAIQKVGGECLGVIRDTPTLEAGVSELERIRKEDLPQQRVTDSSLAFNTEWKEAIENYNLLSITEMSVKASLLREETRGGYFRPEFPEPDDENWKCMLVCKNVDGELEFEKRDVSQVDWESVDWSAVKPGA